MLNFHLIKRVAGIARRMTGAFADWFVGAADRFLNFLERVELIFESAEQAAEQQIVMEAALVGGMA